MARTKLEKIAGIEEEIRQLENQRKQLIQRQKEQERKERTHRLCKRGGLLESLVPDTVTLTDEQFKTFLEKTIAGKYARNILVGLAEQKVETITSEPAKMIQHPDVANLGDGGNDARVAGQTARTLA